MAEHSLIDKLEVSYTGLRQKMEQWSLADEARFDRFEQMQKSTNTQLDIILAKLEVLLQKHNLSLSSSHGAANSCKEIPALESLNVVVPALESLNVVVPTPDESLPSTDQMDVPSVGEMNFMVDAVKPTGDLNGEIMVLPEATTKPIIDNMKSFGGTTLVHESNFCFDLVRKSEAIFKNQLCGKQTVHTSLLLLDAIYPLSGESQRGIICFEYSSNLMPLVFDLVDIKRVVVDLPWLIVWMVSSVFDSPPPKPPDLAYYAVVISPPPPKPPDLSCCVVAAVFAGKHNYRFESGTVADTSRILNGDENVHSNVEMKMLSSYVVAIVFTTAEHDLLFESGAVSDFWGFEAHGIIQDSVTMEKGIGTGAPIGAVVTIPEITIVWKYRYEFSSCKIALATFDVDESRVGCCSWQYKLGMTCKECLKRLNSLRHVLILPYFFDEYSIKSFYFKRSRMIFGITASFSRLHAEGLDRLLMLVIDEAAQLKECESNIPSQLSSLCHVVLIGDEKQLPALVKSEISDKEGFGRSLFDRLVLLGLLQNISMRKRDSRLDTDALGKGFVAGLDDILEAANASKFWEVHSSFYYMCVPTVFLHPSQKRMLPMEWMVGEIRTELLFPYNTTCLLLETGLLLADPHPGNFRHSSSGQIGTSKFICKRDNVAYYCYCVQPPHMNVSIEPYLCTNHTRCHQCGFNVPGNAPSVESYLEYTGCDKCGRLIVEGKNYCYVVCKVHVNLELKPTVCCDIFQLLLFGHSGNISKYPYFQVGVKLQYTCPTGGESSQVKNIEEEVHELWRRWNMATGDLFVSFRVVVSSIGVLQEVIQQTATLLQTNTIITEFNLVNAMVEKGVAPQVPCYFIFGDSLVDNGNVNVLRYWAKWKTRTITRGSLQVSQLLIQWEDLAQSEATWKNVISIQRHYPNFNLEDKVDFNGEGNVMIPIEGKGNKMLSKVNGANIASQVSMWKQQISCNRRGNIHVKGVCVEREKMAYNMM